MSWPTAGSSARAARTWRSTSKHTATATPHRRHRRRGWRHRDLADVRATSSSCHDPHGRRTPVPIRAPGRPAAAPAWLTQARRTAADWATERGYPTRKDEDWRYTPLGPLLGVPFERPEAAAGRQVSPAEIDRSSIDASIARMTFVNGFFAPHLSALTGLPRRGDGDEPDVDPRRRGCRPRSRSSPPRPADMATPSTRSTPPWPRTAPSFASQPGTLVDGLIELLFYSDGHGTPRHVQPAVDDRGRSGQPAGPRRNLRRERWCRHVHQRRDPGRRRPRSDSRALQDPRRTRHRIPSRAARRAPGPRQPVLVAVGGARREDRPPRSTGPPRRRRRPHHHQRPVPARRRQPPRQPDPDRARRPALHQPPALQRHRQRPRPRSVQRTHRRPPQPRQAATPARPTRTCFSPTTPRSTPAPDSRFSPTT